MKVLMISTDRKILEEGSAVRARMALYGTICDELHIVIPTYNLQPTTYNQRMQISSNVFAYPAAASNKIFALFRAYSIGSRILSTTYHLPPTTYLVTAQDPFENGFTGWLIARKVKAKLQLQIHTDFLSPYFSKDSFLNKIRVMLAKFLLPKADSIRVVSERIKKSLVTCHLSLIAIPTVLPIFVDIEKIRKAIPTTDLRKKYPQFDFVILMASRLTKEKNISLAIDAMIEVVKKHPRAGLTIVGSGPESENLKFKIKNLKLNDNVVMEPWQNDMISYYKTADAFLNTSNYEGFGMTLVEAAASDCPVVTTDVGIVGSILRPEGGVLVCPVGDAGCVSERLLRLINSAKLKEELVLKAQTSIETLEISKDEYLRRMRESWGK